MQKPTIRVEKVVAGRQRAGVHAAYIFAHTKQGVGESDFATKCIAVRANVGGQDNAVMPLESLETKELALDDIRWQARVDLAAAQRGPTAAVAIANGGWFGGGMHVAPTARIDDAQLEIIRFGDLARTDFVVSLPRLYRGTHYTHPKVRAAQGRELLAAPVDAGARAIEIEADGEIIGALPARFSVRPAALALLV